MENQAIAQRPNERDIQKRFNSRNAISSSILIVIGVFMVSLTLTMHTTDSNILSLVLMVCGGTDFESCLQNRICSYRQYN